MKKPLLIVTVGLPGSGKSTYLSRIGVNAISTDAIRQQLADDPTDQTIHKQVYATLRYLARQRVKLGREITYLDATNLTCKDRRQYFDMAKKWGCAIQALYFETPVAVCQERNRNRGRVVPEAVIAMMAEKLVPPTAEEGFESVSVIST